jgi:hypothetical protein
MLRVYQATLNLKVSLASTYRVFVCTEDMARGMIGEEVKPRKRTYLIFLDHSLLNISCPHAHTDTHTTPVLRRDDTTKLVRVPQKATSKYGKIMQSTVAVVSRHDMFRRIWFAILESPMISHANVSFKLY